MTEMYDCPYSPGLQCNQRPSLCDKGQFESHCVMGILRMISTSQEINYDYVKKQGMQDALLWLMDHDFWPKSLGDYCVMDVTEQIFKELQDEKQKKLEKLMINSDSSSNTNSDSDSNTKTDSDPNSTC